LLARQPTRVMLGGDGNFTRYDSAGVLDQPSGESRWRWVLAGGVPLLPGWRVSKTLRSSAHRLVHGSPRSAKAVRRSCTARV